MKVYAAGAIVGAALGFVGEARGQQCYTPVRSWQGSYTLNGTGSGVQCKDGTCDISQVATAVVQMAPTVIECGLVSWTSTDTVMTLSLNDKDVIPCPTPPGGVETETYTGTSGVSGSVLTINPTSGTYTYFAGPTANFMETTQYCDGSTGTTSGMGFPINELNYNPQSFSLSLPTTVESLKGSLSYQGMSPVGGAVIGWNQSFVLNPIYSPDDNCQQQGNSSIGCQNQSLGEDVPIVGTGFSLHYESSRTPGAGGNSVASPDASMIGGWTLSVHHEYDANTSTLFLGDGLQRNGYQLGSPVSFNGNLLLTSEDGSEVYVFSSAGQHLQTLRPLTGALLYQFGYDAAGKLVTVTDASGNITTIQRDAAERPTAIVSPYGQTTTLSVGSNGFLSQVTDPLGKSTALTSSSTGLLASRTDQNGNIFNYTYDTEGRLAKDADSIGGFTALTRTDASSGFGWTTGETTSIGRTNSYQSTLNVPWVQNGTSTFSKQGVNTWPNGLQASETTSQQGSEISESLTLPDGTSDSDTLGPDPIWGIQAPVVSSETLTLGDLTMSITVSRTASLGTAGNPFSLTGRTDTTSINSRTYTSAFSASNLTFVDNTSVGRTLTTVLDSQERVASTEVAGLLPSNFVYDGRGRLSTVTRGTRTSTLTYDTDGRLATATDPAGLQNSFSYDPDGRLLSKTLPDGRVIGYSYDANGNLTSVTPPGGSAHTFTYTAVDEMAEYVPPRVSGTGPTTYSYNLDRDLTGITRPDGNSIAFGYDNAGRLSSVTTPSEIIGYTYDSTTGNLTAANITNGESLSYGYNGPLPTSTTWAGPINGSVSRVYNNNFWVTSQSINGGNTIAFTYDDDGLLTGAGALTLARSPQNALITGTTLGGASDSRSYNPFGELTDYCASYGNGPLLGISYTRDADGRITNKTESDGTTFAYSYDPAGRLAGVSKNGVPISSYSYDTNSNRLSATTSSGTVSATYDDQDRLLTYGTATYAYTANGELASQAAGTQTTTYQYDVHGNLISVGLPGGKTISYVVDAENRRVAKAVNGTVAEGFLYDGNRIVAQLVGSASSEIGGQFIYTTGSTSPDYMVSGGVSYRIFSDHLGSPLLVVNTSTGAIAEQIAYDEFGNVLSDTNPGFQPFGFAGGLYDQDTKLVRFGARDYDPNTGHWTAKDRIRFKGGDTNLYGYVLNDPINLKDPSGLQEAENCSCPDINQVKKHMRVRRSRLIGQLPGRKKLKTGSRLLVSRFPEIKFILSCCGVL